MERVIKVTLLIVVLAIIATAASFSFAVGQNVDAVELTHAIKSESTLDEIQELRELESRRSPLPFICGTTAIFLFVLTLYFMKDINKVLRSAKALIRPPETRQSRPLPHHPQYPPTTITQAPPTTPLLPDETGTEHDF